MAVRIKHIRAVEIIDSFGQPALEVRVALEGGATGVACVPSGAGTYDTWGVAFDCGLGAGLGSAMSELSDQSFDGLEDLDEALRKLGRMAEGAAPEQYAILGASIAAARAMAAGRHEPLWRFLAAADAEQRLPVPQFTLINGGGRADTRLDFEQFMIVPVGAPTMRAALRAGTRVHRRLRAALAQSALDTQVGDDGGFAPQLDWPERALELIVECVDECGYDLGGAGVAVALRVAAGGFRQDGRYRLAGESLSSEELVSRYEQMAADFPVCSIEDAMAPDDWDGWAQLTRRLGGRVQLVGGDLFADEPESIAGAARRSVANAALIRTGGFGTVTETLDAVRTCRQAGYAQVVVHQGETSDDFVADLAVAAGCGQLRAGAPLRGERVANYNRLIEIEAEDGLAYGV